MCFSKCDIDHYDELSRPMSNMLLNESLWNDKCDYISPDSCTNLNPYYHNLIVLQMNIRGLISHKADLHQLLNTLKLKNSTVDVVLLCETFLNEITVKQVHIPGYTLISNHRRQHKGGSTAILVREGITFVRKPELDTFTEKHVESAFIDILTKSHKHIVIGSMYRPPNNTDDSFLEAILKLRQKLSISKEKKELIIGMDHNYDLL